MQPRKLRQSDEDFYALMGPVFGSRSIEKATRDRFYDDAGKIWYLIPGKAAASVLENTIRNFWAEDGEAAKCVIEALKADYRRLRGVLPNQHETVFREQAFAVQGYRKNYIEVYWDEKD